MMDLRPALCVVLICLSESGAHAQQEMTKPATMIESSKPDPEPSAAKAGSYFYLSVVPVCGSPFKNCLMTFPEFEKTVMISDISCVFVSNNPPRAAVFETSNAVGADRYHLSVNDTMYTVDPDQSSERAYTTTINQRVFFKVKKGVRPRLNFKTEGAASARWGDASCSLQGVAS